MNGNRIRKRQITKKLLKKQDHYIILKQYKNKYINILRNLVAIKNQIKFIKGHQIQQKKP